MYIYIYTLSDTPKDGGSKLLISYGDPGNTFYEMLFCPPSEPLSLDRNASSPCASEPVRLHLNASPQKATPASAGSSNRG